MLSIEHASVYLGLLLVNDEGSTGPVYDTTLTFYQCPNVAPIDSNDIVDEDGFSIQLLRVKCCRGVVERIALHTR